MKENNFYTPKYIYSFKDEFLYDIDLYEAKNHFYLFTSENYKCRTFLIVFPSKISFSNYYNNVFGYNPDNISECYLYKDSLGNIISYLNFIESDLEYIGKFYCNIDFINKVLS